MGFVELEDDDDDDDDGSVLVVVVDVVVNRDGSLEATVNSISSIFDVDWPNVFDAVQ
jgi:hypothetical protein